jgi:Spy/CpxP family protein refolding chaperone
VLSLGLNREMEDRSMVFRRLAIFAFATILAVAAKASADQQTTATKIRAKGAQILNALATKLNLSDAQKDQIRKIHDEFEQKAQPARDELWKLRHERRDAIKQVLTPEQRAELSNAIKTQMQDQLKDIADKLGMTEAQRRQAQQLAKEYQEKFHALAQEKGANVLGRFRELRGEEHEAFCQLLTDDQRVKLPSVLKGEMDLGRDGMGSNVAVNLQLTGDQKKQINQIRDDYRAKIAKQKDELRQMWKDKHAAMAKVLNDSQREKFRELIKDYFEKTE